MNINSNGFRGDEITKIKPDNTYRIIVVGGSTVMGNTATSDDTTITGALQHFLDNSNLPKNVEVINAGIGGAFSFTEVNFIKNSLINYSPDLLIIYDGWNDVTRELSVMHEDSADYNLQTIILRKLIIKNDFIKSPGLFLKIYNNYKFSMTESRNFNENGIDEKAELWKTRWMDICELGSKNNFDVVVTLQPLVGTGEKILTLEEKIYYKKYDHENLIPNYEKYGQKLDEMNNVCTKVFDLRNAFDGQNDTIFHDSGHVGDKGNKIIAEKMHEIILSIINEDISKSHK
jgi:lysophospholipase L1-like esterase